MLQQVLAQGVRNLQPADECKYRYILTAVENLGNLALEVVDVGLEAVILLHFDYEKVVVVPLGILMRAY